jgi:hypothetical protein
MSIFIILNYYEYYKYISLKLKSSIYFDAFMVIPNNFINNINVITFILLYLYNYIKFKNHIYYLHYQLNILLFLCIFRLIHFF